MSDLAVNLRRVTKIYGQGRTAVKALDEIDLAIERGCFLAIMGPSGSGKSTLLNVIGGLDRPTAGEVYIGDLEVTGQDEQKLYLVRRHLVGFVFQSFHLAPTLGALDNVLLPALPTGLTPDIRQRAVALLERVGMERRLDRRPGELSAGEQQRVAIARALIMNPPVVLADEPTGNLDSRTAAEVVHLIEELNRETGKTFLLVTHDPRVARHCHRVVYLRDGRLCSRAEAGLEALP
ncbi:MAG TPA: ABC transporter ATP-binding protein [Isosphaeraceae bacterium]|jgi:putative ABC transport system ATP-binding protein|nr:ABC transporter ATP-binding protein [Isosphaeraceae bacterium]